MTFKKKFLILLIALLLSGNLFAQDKSVRQYVPISLKPFSDSKNHWYGIYDKGNIIQPKDNQPTYPESEITKIADNILLYQRSNGGWIKNYDMQAVLTREQADSLVKTKDQLHTTFDNSTTHTHIDYLAKVYKQTKDEKYREACLKGIRFVLSAQYPVGGWPQYFPLEDNYSRRITFNDGAYLGIMALLRKFISDDPNYGFIGSDLRKDIQVAYNKGLECILNSQIISHGRLTAWCQQHSEVDLQPVWARAFEPPSICNGESVPVVLFLMSLDKPDQRIIEAIQGAVRWFEKSKILYIRVETVRMTPENSQYKTITTDRVVVTDSLAPPVWTRFYELGSERPLFSDRNSKYLYSLAEVSFERRNGYAWYTNAPREVLKKYPAWQKKWVPEDNVLKSGNSLAVSANNNEPWLDFNMFQSGHRNYAQDTSRTDLRYGEDNWRYIQSDYSRTPVKPTLVNYIDPENEFKKHSDQIRKIALENQVGLVDVYEVFEFLYPDKDKLSGYMSQVNHPNELGHELIADEIIKWFNPKLPPGFPDRSANLDALPGFKTPPAGYGDVAFYWWIGDTLTKERITWQLDELKDKKITGLQINYCHTDAGGASYGLTYPSLPALFSDKWWELFNWFLKEAKKREMSVSLSDYTLGAAGQGWFVDEMLNENPQLNGSKLESKQWTLTGGKELKTAVPDNLLFLAAYPEVNGKLVEAKKIDLKSAAKNSELKWTAPSGDWKIIAIYQNTIKTSFDPMNPLSGAKTIEKFYQRFEDQNPGEAGKGLNFFFSDELQFGIRGLLWNDQFASEFKRRKGYDILPELPNLFADFGLKSYKIRLDYNDVMVGLSEESFFKPLYDWHTNRGMLFGCDHGGRGRDITEFGDYFRTQRWMSGPGSDQPHLQKDLIKAKVAASIAHMYERPRVWLEGFYGSGWGTSSADVTDAIFANFNMGYNLLSLHGLYYTTKGGWWEWAPPCNHFHMPYWKQIDPLMDCVERLSYLLSQGHHRCDVAVIYPTEPVVADLDGKNSTNIAFNAGTELFSKGIDFDYMDYESLARSEVKNGELHIAGEKFKVLIIPSMKVIRHASLLKIEEFKNAGGIVVNIGEKSVATELSGVKDSEVSKLISGVYSKATNLIQCKDEKEVVSAISGKYIPDFKILSEISSQPYVLHRIVGNRDVYALYNLPAGTKCFFKAKGNVELWNPWTTEITSLSKLATQVKDGTEITLPLSEKEMQIIVFTNDNSSAKDFVVSKVLKTIPVEGNWEFELNPSLDNQWGDFQLPATNEMLGAQVRQLYFTENKSFTGSEIKFDESWKKKTCAFGKQFLKLGALPVLPSEQEIVKMVSQKEGEIVKIENKDYQWTPYGFSWQQGVEGDYGYQGYHGLKGQMYDNFIRLGKLEEYKHSLRRAPETVGNFYVLSTSVIAPSDGTFDILAGETKPSLLFINDTKSAANSTSALLKKGANPVLLVYNMACETYLVFRKMNTPRPAKQPVSMCWYQDNGILSYDTEGTRSSSGLFAFESAPGLQSFSFSAYGNVQVWADGNSQKIVAGEKHADGLTAYQVILSNPGPSSAQIVLKIEYQPGYRGMAAIPEYIKQTCGAGTIELGDWSVIDGLRAYSGGALYRKTIAISSDDLKNNLEIDLGDLVSSAELFVNGKSAGIRLAPPWKFDITAFAKSGENKIEIMIYNTLANNYTTIPTRYRGSIKSGLIGPVSLKVMSLN